MKRCLGPLFLLWTICLLGPTGCGGSGQTRASSRGAVQISVLWPEPSRLIPTAAQSIRVDLSAGGQPVGSPLLIRRPEANLTVGDLPGGTVLTIRATAYPNPDGSGVAQATGTAMVTVEADRIVPVTLTMGSTIHVLEIAPANPALVTGQSASLAATARDAAGNVVLVGPGSIAWSSSAPAVASVDALGRVTGASAGSATITATETESGRTASVSVSVVVSVSISPASATLTLRQSQTFTATVAGSANPAVTWSVQEGTAGGTIDGGGVYTAPAVPGTYHVVAASQVDPNQTATATVTVQAGSGTVIVD